MCDLIKVEKIQNVTLPEIYKEMYASKFNKLFCESKLILPNEEITITSFLDTEKIINIIQEYHELFGYDIIPFAETKYEDYICFYYNNSEKPSIVFWNYELALENPNEGIFYLCDDFSEFFSKIK